MKSILSIFFIIISMSTQAQDNFPEKYQWKNRLIFLFSSNEDNDKLQKQVEILEGNKRGIEDRDLKIFKILPDKIFSADNKDLMNAQASDLWRDYDVGNQFTFILIGKDGTEKLRSSDPVTIEKLFATIDAMPMRRREMKDGN